MTEHRDIIDIRLPEKKKEMPTLPPLRRSPELVIGFSIVAALLAWAVLLLAFGG